MKQSFFSLFLLLCFFAPIRANDTISISQTMAIQAISSLYVGQNVDLYIGEGIISVYPGPGGGSIGPLGLEQTGPNSIDLPRLNYPTTHWVVYVDKEPTKNGLHNNMYYWIKKKNSIGERCTGFNPLQYECGFWHYCQYYPCYCE